MVCNLLYIFNCPVTHKETGINSDLVSDNQQLAEELHKPVISKLEKRKFYSFFKDKILGADLADMQLISKCYERL